MNKSKPIILASTSPYRKKLLDDAHIKFIAMAAKADEHSVQGFSPAILAGKRAEFKAFDVAGRMAESCVIIGADQVLGFRGKSYDKAQTAEEAALRLREFQGQTHYLHSAFCLIELVETSNKNQFEARILVTKVVDIPMTMKALSDESISKYVATGEWQGCVGCYRIEGEGRHLFSAVGASESAIIGLPMQELIKELTNHVPHFTIDS